jgi:hypothetical protein
LSWYYHKFFPLTIGARNNRATIDLPFSGDIASMRMYNRLLTDEEILSDYNDTLGMFRLRRRRVFAAVAAGTILPQMLQHNHFTGGRI